MTDVFPALVGLEETIWEMINRPQAGSLFVSRINFPREDEFGRYFDLHVEMFVRDTAVLLLTIQDTTQQARQEFMLRQRLNELRLFSKK